MEDWQKWTRRAANASVKKPPQYLFFPNRTVGQTYFITLMTGVAIMSLSYGLLKSAGESQEKLSRTMESDIRIRNCDITNENHAIVLKHGEEDFIRRKRRYLKLNPKPASAVLISDPELRNNEKSGYIEL